MIEEVIKLLVRFRLLNTKDVLTLACVNRAFQVATDKPSVWRIMAENSGYPHKNVPDANIKYRFLNTDIGENYLSLQEKTLASLERYSGKYEEIIAVSEFGACIAFTGGAGFELVSCSYSFSGCCGAAPPCQFCTTLYPCCYSAPTTALSGIGHLVTLLAPPLGVLACGIMACVGNKIYAASKDYEFNNKHTKLTSKIETLKKLIETHGLFAAKPQRISMMNDNNVSALIQEKANESTPLLRK